MKMLKISLIAVVSLVVLGIALSFVNYYVYSWATYFLPFGCEYKSINAKYDDKYLEQEYDLIKIGEQIKLNPNYKLEKPPTKSSLTISRMYGDVKYNIGIGKIKTSDGSITKIVFSNFNFDAMNNSRSNRGEKSITPNYYIEKNIYQMIDEMPLDDAQKKELKEKVEIGCKPSVVITPF